MVGGELLRKGWGGWRTAEEGVGWVENCRGRGGVGGELQRKGWGGWRTAEEGVGWVENCRGRGGVGGELQRKGWGGWTTERGRGGLGGRLNEERKVDWCFTPRQPVRLYQGDLTEEGVGWVDD